MKKYAALIITGVALMAISAIWVVPKIGTNKQENYVRVIEKPDARSHWDGVKKNVEAVQLEKKTQKQLKNPDRFETKKVSVKEFVFDEDMYGRGMHYEPSVLYEEPMPDDSTAASIDSTTSVSADPIQSNESE